MRVGVFGATGQVGGVMRKLLAERNCPVDEIRYFTSERSAGKVLPIVLELPRLCTGKSAFRMQDFLYFVQVCGVESLPIVSLIAVLVGVILSFVGAVQLQLFGAEIYIANLVALGMVMEMGALMSGIIIAGRIGAAYAAQLGTMQTNEEIDVLRTISDAQGGGGGRRGLRTDRPGAGPGGDLGDRARDTRSTRQSGLPGFHRLHPRPLV